MIELKTAGQIEKMRAAGRLSKQALELAGSMVREGITTKNSFCRRAAHLHFWAMPVIPLRFVFL